MTSRPLFQRGVRPQRLAAAAITFAALATHCSRAPSGTPPAPAAPARRPAPPPFTHPLFAGQPAEVVTADCSRAALTRLAERVRVVDRVLVGRRPDTGSLLEETRNELLPGAAACVGHDGPLDVPWEMLHSAILSLEICADVGQPRDERMQRCRRARDIAARADRGG